MQFNSNIFGNEVVNIKSETLTDLMNEITKYGPKKTQTSNLMDSYLNSFKNRMIFTDNLSWAVPSKEAIDEIVKFVGNDKIIEIGSGLGLWSQLLKLSNLDLVATDNFSSHIKMDKKRFCEIEELDAVSAVNKYNDRNVLMTIWPPMSDMSSEALKCFKGSKLIYAGEQKGDCTACDEFFDILEEEWRMMECIQIPHWEGIHDELYLYRRISH